MKTPELKILLFDIGGVLLNNGWGHESREKAAQRFAINYEEMNVLHTFIFNTYETGKITLDEYLDTVVFSHPRSFSRDEFKAFMFAESVELPGMLAWLMEWKRTRCHFRVIAVNNEGRELNQYRIAKFNLHEVFDAFVSSCEVGMVKPDPGIWRLAMGIAQAKPEQCVFIDDRIMLVRAARKLGIKAHHHETFEMTKQLLEDLTHNPLAHYEHQLLL
ncbi:HAD family hydrolase [Spirosoma arcticum]